MGVTGHYLGVDAGNSKTIAAVCTEDGVVVGWGRAGVGDIYAPAGAPQAAAQVQIAIDVAVHAAGIELADVTHAAFRLAGVDWPEDEAFWREIVRSQLDGIASLSVKNDGFALLRFASESGVGLSVVAGTGPALAARGPDGREFNASWWIRDLLGGLGLGEAAFTAAVKADLGMAPQTALRALLLAHHGDDDLAHLLERFTRRVEPLPREQHSTAARVVLDAASDGDAVARSIVETQASKLAAYASATAERVGFDLSRDRIPIALGGGVLQSENTDYRSMVESALLHAMPAAELHPVTASPILGALLDAVVESGRPSAIGLRERLASTSRRYTLPTS